MRFSVTFSRIFFFCLASIVLVVFFAANVWINVRETQAPVFGITFSTVYAKQLGLDVKEAYQSMIDELGVRHIRLPVYWSEIETESGVYQWEMLDALVEASERASVKLTPVIGMKVPRWPECFIPGWANTLTDTERHERVLDFMKVVVERYRLSSALWRWQVENEPFLAFGECPAITLPELKERIELVRSLDDRPIQLTVSGELQPWKPLAEFADVLGISLYRTTWDERFGFFVYPLESEYYTVRSRLVAGHVESVIVSELQAEPWFPEPIASRALTEWYDFFDREALRSNIQFVRDADIAEAYVWGVEWWYALKKAGEERLWDEGKMIFKE